MALTLPYKNYITKEEILENSGYNLEKRLAKDDRASMNETINGFLKEVARLVYGLIASHKGAEYANKVFETCETNAELQQSIARAEYYQAIYIFENGDLSSQNGYTDNGMINLDELRGYRNYSQSCIDELISSGILYSGIR